jgi:fructokinase
MKVRPVLAAIGEVLWDVYPDAARFGGAPANFACHAAALGADAVLISAVGQDELGDRALETLSQHEVDSKCVVRDGNHPTGHVNVTLDRAGRANYQFAENSAWDHLSWSEPVASIARQADAVCFGTLAQRSSDSRDTIRRFVERTPAGTLRMFDVNLRQSFYDADVIDASLRLATAVKLNEEELPVVARLCGVMGVNARGMLRGLVERYELWIAALTCGPDGALLMTADQESRCPALPTTVVDTVGAGDAFTATLVMDCLHGVPLGEINQHANAVASFICSQAGAVAPLPPELLLPTHSL